jgi:hypothetical protein
MRPARHHGCGTSRLHVESTKKTEEARRATLKPETARM